MILGDPQLLPPHLRQDLYYRLYADVIRTPTLREQIAGESVLQRVF